VDVCSLFTDAALAPPVPDGRADARGRAPVAEIVDCPESPYSCVRFYRTLSRWPIPSATRAPSNRAC
jgi:hypothetical protein